MTNERRFAPGKIAAPRAGLAALLASASVGALGVAPADAQVVRDVPSARGGALPTPDNTTRRLASEWSFDLRATYSDNFRRIDDERRRQLTFTPNDAAVQPVSVPFDVAPVETPDNVIFTVSMRGGTVYQRPGLNGIVRGGIAVTANADDASLDERLQGTPLPPQETLDALQDALFPDGFDGVLSQSFGRPEEQELFIRPDIAASATARIVDQLFYVDVAAVAQQQIINQRDAIQGQVDGQVGDVTTFVGGSVSPYLNRQLGGNGVIEARLRGSAVVVADEQFEGGDSPLVGGADIGDRRFANDSLAAEAILDYDSAQLFDRVAFGLRASAARSEEDGSDIIVAVDLTRLTAAGEARYDLGRNLAILGEVGYDDVAIDEDRPGEAPDGEGEGEGGEGLGIAGREDEFSGVFWSLGAEYAPSVRSRLALSVGERFGGTQVNGQLTYRPTPRLSVTGRAERILGTGTQDGFQGAINLNSQTLQIVEQLAQIQSGSARELLQRAVGFQGGFSNIQQQAFGVQVRNTYNLSAAYTARRTDFGLSVFFDQSEFGDGEGERQNDRLAFQGSVSRDVSRRVRAGLSARYERLSGTLPVEAALDEDAPDQSSDQLFVSADASYQVGPRLAVTARAYRAVSSIDGGEAGAPFAFGIAREYEENAVSAGIRWTF